MVILDLNTYTARTLLGLLLLITFGLVVVCISQHFKHKEFCRLATRKHLAQERELKASAKDIENLKAQCQKYLQRHLSIQYSQEGIIRTTGTNNSILAEMQRFRRDNIERSTFDYLISLPYHNPKVTVVHKMVDVKDSPDEGPTVLDRILADDT